MKFSGFPRGTQYTPVPNPLFGPLLEAIGDPAELKCTLRALWLLHQKKGYPRYLTAGELLSDRVLLIGLKGLDVPPPEAIRRGMRSAVERETFLSLSVTPPKVPPYQGEIQGGHEELYFLNDEGGRRAVTMIDQGDISIKGVVLREGVVGEPPGSRANIFTLYEENIGMLTPILADEMKEAEGSYPWPWIEEAFKIAVSRNVRNWRYIEATLRRWATEGKDDGESRRYSQKASSTEDPWEYLRRRGRLHES